MSRAGQHNYKGVTYQAWAAFLLFLLKLDEGGFQSVTLEDSNWEDFTLNYGLTKKIICEVKNYARPLGKSQVKTILKSISARQDSLNDNDEILIISPTSPAWTRNVQYLKYFPQSVDEYKKLGFSEEEINLLSKTSFFAAKDSEYLYQEASTYFYSKIGYWLPQHEVDGLINTVLVKQIYEKSVKGEIFSRQDLADAINDYIVQTIKQHGVYDSEKTETEAQIQNLVSDVRNKRSLAIGRDLTDLTGQPPKMFILLDSIFGLDNLALAEWNVLWERLIDRQYASRIIHEFDKHIGNKENARYVVQLFTNQILALTNKALDSMHAEFALQTIQKALKQHPDLVEIIFKFSNEYLANKSTDYLSLDSRHNRTQEKQLIAEILLDIFEIYLTQNNNNGQLSILDLIKKNFNLVEDDGEHSIYTPPQIFQILNKYLQNDIPSHFQEILDTLTKQFSDKEYYGGSFKGWELAGGTFSQSGNYYSINDRHFISHVLQPGLLAYYEANPENAWIFINDKCVSNKISDVSDKKPDFLGRAVIPILLREYKEGEHAIEAFSILKKQMLMKQGIPAKFELIFQALHRGITMPDDKKWQLTKVFLDTYKLPNSVFVEQVTTDLAMTGYQAALDTIKNWVSDPEYRKQQTRHTFFVSQSMFKLLETPIDSNTYVTGIGILKAYIKTEDYRKELDSFHAYDITKAISKIILSDFEVGIGIIDEIYNSSDELTINEQIAIIHPLEQIGKDNAELLAKAYDKFLKPIIFEKLQGNIELVAKRFPHNYARELIVQFAEHMAEAKLYDEALELLKVFLEDPNPRLDNEPDDPDGTFNYHRRIMAGDDNHTINTVRGWCVWVLTKFLSVTGRPYLPKTINYVEALTKDPNYYVRVQSTIPLTGLVQNRHTVMPKNKHERFISLELALRIESIAFAMLRDEDNQKYPVIMKYVAHAFGYMRSMTEEQAWEVLNIFKTISYENDFDDIYPLFVYYALFREQAFKDPSFRELFGNKLYDEINKYKGQRFEDLLKDVIKTGNADVRGRIAWQFWHLPKDAGDDFNKLYQTAYDYLKLTSETPYDRHVFGDIYYFANEYLSLKPKESLELWRLCIDQEKKYLKENEQSLKPGEWWPSYYNSTMLSEIRRSFSDEEYLKVLETLLSYPQKFDPGIGPQIVDAELKEIDNKQAKILLKQLRDMYPMLYT